METFADLTHLRRGDNLSGMVATWLSGPARAAFLLLAFAGCGEAFTGGGNEAGEAGAPGTGGAATGGGGATGKGGSSGNGATGGQGGSSGRAGSAGTGGASGSAADGGDAGSDAGTGGAGTGGNGGGGDSGSGNTGGTSGAGTGGASGAGTSGIAGVAGVAGTAGMVIEPDVPKEGLLLWLRADEGVTLTEEHHVLTWADQSGNGNDAEQTGSDEQPQLVERENGMPHVVFDGIDDFMRLPVGFSDFSAGLSAFVVNNARSLDYCWALLELSNGRETDDIFLGHYSMAPHYEVLDTYLTQGEYPFPEDVLISAVHYPNRNIETRANGSLAGDTSMDLPANVERSQNFLGRSQYESCGVLEGSISEVLLYDRTVSSEELLAIEDYLATRWGCCRN